MRARITNKCLRNCGGIWPSAASCSSARMSRTYATCRSEPFFSMATLLRCHSLEPLYAHGLATEACTHQRELRTVSDARQ
jgi:hypothetical protein